MASHPPPPITVLTPVHNGARYIVATVESVLRQEYPDLEYIVLDDGSTDGTADRLNAYRGAIRLESHPNMGEARTVNRGLALASNDLVCIVNADDPILPGLLGAAGRALADDDGLSAVYPDWIWIDAAGSPVRNVVTHEFDLRVMLEQHLCIPGPGAVFRRSHLGGEPARNPRRRSSADFDFWLRVGLRGKVRRLPATLATWRQHASGTSAARCNADMARDKVSVIEAFFSRTDLPAEIRGLQSQAMSAAYFNAGMLGLRSADIPASRYFIKSLLAKPIWPSYVLRSQRRSVPHMIYAAAQPFSGQLHHVITPLLPKQWGRHAVLEQRFGVRHEP